MLPRLYWCDCDMIENPPSVNDGEDEDEEVESLHHQSCLLFVTSTWFKVNLVVIPLADLL